MQEKGTQKGLWVTGSNITSQITESIIINFTVTAQAGAGKIAVQ
jgi:hypothetical protein